MEDENSNKRIKLSTSNCPYGDKCYRKNPQHLLEQRHPLLEEIYEGMKACGNFDKVPDNLLQKFNSCGMERRTVLEQVGILRDVKDKPSSSSWNLEDLREQRKRKFLESKEQEQSPKAKNPTSKNSSETMLEKWEASKPYNYFLTKVSEQISEQKGIFSASFADLFHPSLGEVKTSLHINFMVDPEWFVEQLNTAGIEGKGTRLIFNGKPNDLQPLTEAFSWIKVYPVKSPFPYGHHHTKMSIVQYTDCSVRFFVYTANLIESDWDKRTQGIWISPRCPKLEAKDQNLGESVTKFRADLIQYLGTYPIQASKAWMDVIKTADCSEIKVFFIGSAPVTVASGSSGFQWGSCKMEKVLKSLPDIETDPSWPLVIQCSSIGTLGQGIDSWVRDELGSAFSGKDRVQQGPISIIYPSNSNVKTSFEGVFGGGCLPYSAITHIKQKWLERHLCQWKADVSGRSKAVPHIKSYFRMSPKSDPNPKLAWFLLTSANLSKAAWGKMTKARDKLSIMSWEAGVLFVPQIMIGQSHFNILGQGKGQKDAFPLHVDVPLVKYGEGDKPWFFETLQVAMSQE